MFIGKSELGKEIFLCELIYSPDGHCGQGGQGENQEFLLGLLLGGRGPGPWAQSGAARTQAGTRGTQAGSMGQAFTPHTITLAT